MCVQNRESQCAESAGQRFPSVRAAIQKQSRHIRVSLARGKEQRSKTSLTSVVVTAEAIRRTRFCWSRNLFHAGSMGYEKPHNFRVVLGRCKHEGRLAA